MFVRVLNVLLVLAIALGCWQTWNTRTENVSLREEYSRLVEVCGDFRITDKSKIHVLLLEARPGSIAWRVYLPSNVALSSKSRLWKSSGESFTASPSKKSSELVVEWRFRTDGKRVLEKDGINGGGSCGISSGGGESYAELLEHWDELEFEIAGRNEVEVFEPHEIVTLLYADIPESIQGPDSIFFRLGDHRSEEWQAMLQQQF